MAEETAEGRDPLGVVEGLGLDAPEVEAAAEGSRVVPAELEAPADGDGGDDALDVGVEA